MQTKKLSEKMGNENLIVDFAMRYGNPSIKSKLKNLQKSGCENIVVLPLYPQYAAATTATVCDEVYKTLMGMRWQPSLQIIPHYESEPLYINSLKNSLEKNIRISLGTRSYCSIVPWNTKKYFSKGDLTIATVKKPQGCYLKNLRKFQLKLHFNQDLVPRMASTIYR